MSATGTWVALVVTISLVGRGTPWALPAGLALTIWLAYFYRLINMAVIVRGDCLEARNLRSTRRIERATVAEVALGESSVTKAPNQTVIIRTMNGQQIPLDACARSMQSRWKRRRVEEFHRRLALWAEPAEVAAILDPGGPPVTADPPVTARSVP